MNNTSGQLIDALKSGKLLEKVEGENIMYAFIEIPGYVELKGWGSALYKKGEALVDIVMSPEKWRLSEHKLTGYPYPWSSKLPG